MSDTTPVSYLIYPAKAFFEQLSREKPVGDSDLCYRLISLTEQPTDILLVVNELPTTTSPGTIIKYQTPSRSPAEVLEDYDYEFMEKVHVGEYPIDLEKATWKDMDASAEKELEDMKTMSELERDTAEETGGEVGEEAQMILDWELPGIRFVEAVEVKI